MHPARVLISQLEANPGAVEDAGLELGLQTGAVLFKADGQFEMRPSGMAGMGVFLDF